jgi:hypothetical protein
MPSAGRVSQPALEGQPEPVRQKRIGEPRALKQTDVRGVRVGQADRAPRDANKIRPRAVTVRAQMGLGLGKTNGALSRYARPVFTALCDITGRNVPAGGPTFAAEVLPETGGGRKVRTVRPMDDSHAHGAAACAGDRCRDRGRCRRRAGTSHTPAASRTIASSQVALADDDTDDDNDLAEQEAQQAEQQGMTVEQQAGQ